MKSFDWKVVLKVLIAVATALLGAVGASQAMN